MFLAAPLILALTSCCLLAIVGAIPTQQQQVAAQQVAAQQVAAQQESSTTNTAAKAVGDKDVKKEEVAKSEMDPDFKLLLEDALDWSHNTGAIMRTKKNPGRSDVMQVLAISLFPSPFPRQPFLDAAAVQKSLNLMFWRLTLDYDFLYEAHKDVLESDACCKKLLAIMREVQQEGQRQPISVLLHRADYMLNVVPVEGSNEPKYEMKQVEINMGAIGGAGLTPRVTEFHRRIAKNAGLVVNDQTIPENHADTTLASALYLAWQKFGDPKAIMITVCEKRGDRFKGDQRYTEYEIDRLSGGKVNNLIMSLVNCAKLLYLDDQHRLRYGDHVVALVYYRKSFNIGVNMLNKDEWRIVRDIERSTAIKSPTVGITLGTTKKVQQYLALPGKVERFFPDPKDAPIVEAIRDKFAGLWSLSENDERTQKIVKDAIAHPDRYVLKPNREGGGNNIWDGEIAKKLTQWSVADRSRFILMQRFRPLIVKNYMIRAFVDPKLVDVSNEVCFYGALVGDIRDGSVLHNEAGGYEVKTKQAECTEGGLCFGTAVYDSLYLY